MDNSYNLADEAWIPVADVGKVSLMQIFKNEQYRSLGGSPVQKISVMKLLLAVAQAACTPVDEDEWCKLGAQGLAKRCEEYLNKWRESLYLYGDKPFLQMPKIAAAKMQDYAAVQPEVSSGNTTVLSQVQVESKLDDADKSLLLLGLMNFALGGKKTDNSVTLTPGYVGKRNEKGKPSSSKPGPSVAFFGLLHTFLTGQTLQQTIWLNLLTSHQINQNKSFEQGLGIAPWEQMPEGEDCLVAKKLKQSVMGRLIAINRFCLLTPQGLHYSEGIAHFNYKEGMIDPSAAVNFAAKEPKALWTDPEKRPWRELTALLGFFEQGNTQGFKSWQVSSCLDRTRDAVDDFALWSGGLRISNNAGEQFPSGSDDFVESTVWLKSNMLGANWFAQLKIEMSALDELSKTLYGCVCRFYKEQRTDGTKHAAQATHVFWQFCERHFQELVNECDATVESKENRVKLHRRFANYLDQSYSQFCAKETSRQLDAWAKCRPNHSKY